MREQTFITRLLTFLFLTLILTSPLIQDTVVAALGEKAPEQENAGLFIAVEGGQGAQVVQRKT